MSPQVTQARFLSPGHQPSPGSQCTPWRAKSGVHVGCSADLKHSKQTLACGKQGHVHWDLL